MRKRISCLLISLLFLCCTLFAACGETVTGQELTSGDYLYTIRDDGTAMIRKYTGQAVSVRIPSELEGVAVTAIGPWAFQANTTLIDVVIPEGIVSIDHKGKAPGRGAYICKSEACLTRAVKQKQLERALETKIDDSVFERLAEEINAD